MMMSINNLWDGNYNHYDNRDDQCDVRIERTILHIAWDGEPVMMRTV